ncbi:GTP pyrophosphokinase [Devosia naphthalenivorans]|uniref:GTP pyrophosphokinase n=1 Tax=Devosia naphthalenivorans TaxID=2082392 RepID=UPI000D3A6B5E|nr:RelA/SpoT domain-containing protein [Devosia naphthalenivorans]
MNSEEGFLAKWQAEKQAYLAWGDFVAAKIVDLLRANMKIADTGLFLRLPVSPRLKADESLVQKAFHRGKGYGDPYNAIEDKVGIRFVVLTSDDIAAVESAIVDGGLPYWTFEKARDFLAERDARPMEFGYQSVHYVVRSKLGLNFGGIPIPEYLPCEIQIRTLLQHAYSELTHDTLYKPSVKATPDMQRAAAKSMALIEATDDYFRQVGQLIRTAAQRFDRIADALANRYAMTVGNPAAPSALNSLLIDHYQNLVDDDFAEKLSAWLDSKPFVEKNVRSRRGASALYRVPAVLMVYYCASHFSAAAMYDTPLTEAELAPIYSDLGKSMHG